MTKRLLFLLTLLSIASCSNTPVVSQITETTQQQWQFNGRFAIKTPQETQSSKINWAQVNDHYDINLYTTFGITVMKIRGDESSVQITSNGDTHHGTSAEQLIWQMTRWHVPVNQLSHWVKGSVPDALDPTYNEAGQIKQAYIIDSNNQQWLLQLGGYKSFDGMSRPTTLRLSKDALFLKLAISTWHIQK